jgi:magnesium chelatase family protein
LWREERGTALARGRLVIAQAWTVASVGMEAQLVRVEARAVRGIPGFDVLGVHESTAREARYRIRAALAAARVCIADVAIVVNLVPADVRKCGATFDVAMACAVAAAVGAVPAAALEGVCLFGELSLSGELLEPRGVMAPWVCAMELGMRRGILPASVVQSRWLLHCTPADADVGLASSLVELFEALRGRTALRRWRIEEERARTPVSDPSAEGSEGASVDLAHVTGQPLGRRALEVAAAGGHNICFVGPAGAGKSMLARALPSLLPAVGDGEAIEIARVYGAAGLPLPVRGGAVVRPFRAPHHTASDVALVGGGDRVRPGEVSLAHGGVLFLDELPELRRNALEALRQPLEDGMVSISRARCTYTFPARFRLVGAMNPCPCGYASVGDDRCRCSRQRIDSYLGRVSGPLMDRLDLCVRVASDPAATTLDGAFGESSAEVRQRVGAAYEVQRSRRAEGTVEAPSNALLSREELLRVAKPPARAVAELETTARAQGWSTRSMLRVLRVARTLADLDGHTDVRPHHVHEAMGLRGERHG